MKTPLAAAVLLLLAAPSRAMPVPPKAPVDPMKWSAGTERNSASDWFTVTIGNDHYLGYKPTVAERHSGKFPAKDKGYLWSTPLFHYNPADVKNGQVAPEATSLVLEFAPMSAKLQPKVVCTDAAKCKDVEVAKAQISPLAADSSSGFPKDKNLKVVVTPPAAAVTAPVTLAQTDQSTVDTTAGFGAWEKAAGDTIAKANDQDNKADKTNADRRKTLVRHLQTYLEATKGKTTQLDSTEIAFIHRVAADQQRALPLDGFDQAAAANKDSSNPAAAAFIARWRKFISDDVNLYMQLADSLRPAYPGSKAALDDVNKDVRDKGAGATSPLELALVKAHPGTSRMDEAQRKIVAAYIQKHLKTPPDTKDKDQALLLAASQGDPKAYGKVWNRITYNGDLTKALAGNDRGLDLEKLVDRDTLLDAYCDPSKFKGGAVAAPKAASAMSQARAVNKESTTAATGPSTENGNGGTTMDGGGTAAVNANDPCAGRLAALHTKFPDPASNGTPTVVDKNTGVDQDDHNHTGGDDHKGDKFVDDGSHKPGANQVAQDAPGDPNFGDHMRSGFTVGGFLGLIGLFAGGPVGLLVLGGAGFALGFGIDKLTNKGKS